MNDDLDLQQAEEKRKYRELVNENANLDKGKKMSVKFTKNRIVVDDVIVKSKIQVPMAANVLRLTDPEREDIKTVKIYPAGEHSESGSDYSVFIQKVKSESDVQKGIYKMKIRFGDATHVSCAYRLEEAYGPCNQDGLDDGEFGAGRAILSVMKQRGVSNLCIFVVRWCGEQKLGNRRFEILKQLTTDAISTFQFKLKDRQMRLNHSLSQSSLLSVVPQTSEISFDTAPDHYEAEGQALATNKLSPEEEETEKSSLLQG